MEELLASQNQKFITLNRGQQVEGAIVSLTDKEIILDLGAKSEGVLQRREVSGRDLKPGDKLKVFVVQSENDSGQVVLSLSAQVKSPRSFSVRRGFPADKFIHAQNQKTKLTGVVIEVNKGGLIVEVGGVRGFLPNSQVGYDTLSKAGGGMESLTGQNLSLTVIEVDPANNKLIFTQRGQVSEEVKSKLKEFKVGQKSEGKIIAVLPFGLVVDMVGVEGLVFISDISWEKIEDISNMFKIAQTIDVMIIGIDEELGRLNLSLKQLSEDPFKKLAQNFPADEVVKGEIVELNDNGVAVKLGDGTEGFMNASKMDPDTKYEAGKSMNFLVDSVDVKRRRVNLAPMITSTAGLIYK